MSRREGGRANAGLMPAGLASQEFGRPFRPPGSHLRKEEDPDFERQAGTLLKGLGPKPRKESGEGGTEAGQASEELHGP